jgi:hypothetical protein
VEQRAVAVAEEHVAAVVGIINQRSVMILVDCKIGNGEKPYAAYEAELRQISMGQSSYISRGRYPFDGVLSHPFHGAATGPENVFIAGRREQRTRHGSAE